MTVIRKQIGATTKPSGVRNREAGPKNPKIKATSNRPEFALEETGACSRTVRCFLTFSYPSKTRYNTVGMRLSLGERAVDGFVRVTFVFRVI